MRSLGCSGRPRIEQHCRSVFKSFLGRRSKARRQPKRCQLCSSFANELEHAAHKRCAIPYARAFQLRTRLFGRTHVGQQGLDTRQSGVCVEECAQLFSRPEREPVFFATKAAMLDKPTPFLLCLPAQGTARICEMCFRAIGGFAAAAACRQSA